MANVFTWKLNLAQDPILLIPIEHGSGVPDLNAASRLIPGGVYTTFRTFQGRQILPIADHIRRLEESAALVNGAIRLDPAALLAALAQGLSIFYAQTAPQGSPHASDEARARFTLDLEREPGTLYLSLEPLTTPTEQDFRLGVRAVTAHLHRDNPKAKWTGFIGVAEPVRRQLAGGVNECLMLNEQDEILEGLSSNFFAVKGGAIWTAEEGVLAGITRTLVLEAGGRAGIPVRFEPVRRVDLAFLTEAFISSASRSILPVVQIDGLQIGAGEPGPVTRQLMDLYWEFIRSRLITLPFF